jgi:hypothetical protein
LCHFSRLRLDGRPRPLVRREVFGAFLLSFRDVILEGVELTHQGRVMPFPPDPGALRLLAALRATLAGAITFFVILGLGTSMFKNIF